MEDRYYVLSMERCERGIGHFWWKLSEWGYTDSLLLAGQFSRERAFELCRVSGRQDVPVPVAAMGEALTTEE